MSTDIKPFKQALIVDDSKTARVMLKKMLERQGIGVAMVESGEEALDYLSSASPDLIFMDHMMPGMDGFQAVKAIKSNATLAAIPIVMHTTQSSEIYQGQARALGAIDVLGKPATEATLTDLLAQVEAQLSAEQRAQHSESAVVEQVTEQDTQSDTELDNATEDAIVAQATPENLTNHEDSQELNGHSISRAAAFSSDKNPEQGDVEQSALGRVASQASPEVSDKFASQGVNGQRHIGLLPTLGLLFGLLILFLYFNSVKTVSAQQQQLAEYISTLEWSLNRTENYDFGEAPLSAERLQLLKTLVPKLEQAGFTGLIRIEGHVGEFCLSKLALEDGSEISILPEPELPLTACGMIGYSAREAEAESVKESASFHRYLENAGLLDDDASIRVELEAVGGKEPRYPYPEELEGITTGDWNAIALSNNRVRISLLPDQD